MTKKPEKDTNERDLQMTPEQWAFIKELEAGVNVATKELQAALSAVLAGHGITNAELLSSDAATHTMTVRVQ